ncbi:hypothetical protein ACIRBX_36360 [Kitasatospora sp. NPDC096147]|uniref:hypothetical protein n=1 Tax=Kitasatospora sp. NPDC096147 TaxID=3364093 RepID=UPI00381E6D74
MPVSRLPLRARSARRGLAVLTLLATALLGAPHRAEAAPVTATQSQHSTLAVSALSAAPGESVTFTLTVTNAGGSAVQAYQDFTPSGPVFATTDSLACAVRSGPAPGVCVVQPPTRHLDVEWGYGSSTRIPAHSTAEVSVTTTVPADAAPGTYTVTPSGAVGGVASTFTPASFTFEVTGRADLAVGLTATPTALLSSAVTYTQTTTNHGPAAATSATVSTALPSRTTGVTDLPAGCAYDPATRTVACTDLDLAAGTSATHTFTARFGALSVGSLTATATRTASSPADATPADDTATVTCTAITSLILSC